MQKQNYNFIPTPQMFFLGKNLAFPLRSANFPQIPADFPVDTCRICEHLRGNLRKSAGKKHTLSFYFFLLKPSIKKRGLPHMGGTNPNE
jgi:hypothetical protein